MKILYTHMVIGAEGSQVHVNSFVRAIRNLGDDLVDNAFDAHTFGGGKESWSRLKRVSVRLNWVRQNLYRFFATLVLAIRTRPDVLLFRFEPLHEFFSCIFFLSPFYPIVLEINAVRSIENHHGRPWVSDYLDRVSLTRAKGIVVVSEELKGYLIEYYGLAADRITVAPNGVDVALFDPANYSSKPISAAEAFDRFVVGFVGSFRPWHGVDLIIEIASIVVRSIPDVTFLIVGDGADRSKYEEMVSAANLSNNFRFVGFVSHDAVPQYLAQMNVVLAPFPKASYEKGFYGSALKLFEYMAMEKAIIVPPLGQNSQVISHGVSGFLIESEDTQKIASTIVVLANDDALCRSLGKNAREEVLRNYTWSRNADLVRCACERVIL